MIIKIDRYEICLFNNDLSANNGKEGKSGFILPKDVDSVIFYIENFCFTIAFIAKSTSYLNLQWKAVQDILDYS